MTDPMREAYFTDAQLDQMYEDSKRDVQFVGSEIRQLVGDIRTAREALRREAPASSGVDGDDLIERLQNCVDGLESLETLPKPYDLYYAIKNDEQGTGWSYACAGIGATDLRLALDRLTAAPSRPDAGCGVWVKPLEWIDREGVETFDASTPVGHYIATITATGRGAWFIVGLTQSNYTVSDISNVKAAAQADYEQRILSALSTPPAAVESNGSAEARLREALEPFAKMAGAMYVSGHCGGASPEDWPDRWHVTVQGGIDFHTPQQHGGFLKVADFRRAADAFYAVGDEAKKSEGGKEPRGCPTPGACSCPSDPTADVTVEELAQFLRDADREAGQCDDDDTSAGYLDLARALLDAFTVGRR